MIDLLRKFTLEQDIDKLSEENELISFLLKHDYETLIANFQVLVILLKNNLCVSFLSKRGGGGQNGFIFVSLHDYIVLSSLIRLIIVFAAT